MRQEDYFELLVYMITSAAGLKGEPKIYGPLRMIEASERLCSLMLKEDPDNPDLKELREIIEKMCIRDRDFAVSTTFGTASRSSSWL